MTTAAINFSFDSNTSGHGFNATSPSSRSMHLPKVILFGVLAGILSIVTTGGNLLVLIAFRVEKQLRTVSNYFLLSLAVADLLIGVISMPLYTVSSLMGRWPLPHYICDLWLSLDYTMSNASVANLLVISIDRYLSVTRPLSYRVKRTPKRAAGMIAGAWLISGITWTPWIYAWPYIEGQRSVAQNECYIQFLDSNPVLTIVTAVVAFYLPVTIMTILYLRIYRETRRRRRDLARLQGANSQQRPRAEEVARRERLRQQQTLSFSFSQSETDTSAGPAPARREKEKEEEEEVWVLREDSLLFAKMRPSPGTAPNGDPRGLQSREESSAGAGDDDNGAATSGRRRSRKAGQGGATSSGRSWRSGFAAAAGGRKENKNESKAAKTLSAILMAFVITWAPYNLFTVMNAFGNKDEKIVSDLVYSIGYWLCYINSTVNPVCYALCNVNFRRTFWRILMCDLRHTPSLGSGLYGTTTLASTCRLSAATACRSWAGSSMRQSSGKESSSAT